jgi:uncharacterized protein YndB with AHSA1/START domain
MATTAHTAPLTALGKLEKAGDRWQIRFTRDLPHPPEKVWRAITEPEHLAAWFPTTIDGERAAGATLRFQFPFDEAPDMHGEMLAYDPPSLMELRWGDETLRLELTPTAGGTRLVMIDVFDDVGKAARDGAGWHASLDILAFEVSDEPKPWTDEEGRDLDGRWAVVHPLYVEAFGPEASTLGPPDWHPAAPENN